MPRHPVVVDDVIEDYTFKNQGKTNHIKRYRRGRMLGKGGFAECYKITSFDSNRVYACKIIAKASLTKKSARQKLWNEIRLHRSLSHEHVVKFERFFEDDRNVYIILEICHNQSLMEMVRRRRRLSEAETKSLTWQLLLALKYLHGQNIIHRDLKLGNMFLDRNMSVKLGDFGLTTKLVNESERKRTICGTPNYIAPEILDSKVGHSFEVDIWAMGVIMYTMLVGRPPFETGSIRNTYKRIKQNVYEFPPHIQISRSAKDLITSILHTNPAMRPNLSQIMTHSFFTESPFPKRLPVTALRETTADDAIPLSEKVYAPKPPVAAAKPAAMAAPAKPKRAGLGVLRDRTNIQPSAAGATKPGSARPPAAQQQVRDPVDSKATAPASSLATARPSTVAKPTAGVNAHTMDLKIPVATVITQWVTKWADYSSKYGLGFALSNHTYGVTFNDQTRISYYPALSRLEKLSEFGYMERRKSRTAPDVVENHNISKFPEALRKKVTLLKHFKDYLSKRPMSSIENSKSKPKLGRSAFMPPPGLNGGTSPVFVKKWLRTNHAMAFRLTNGSLQMIFNDGTELIFAKSCLAVAYCDKMGEKHAYRLANKYQRPDLQKRFEYFKKIMTHLGAAVPAVV